jgi:uncharacterized RmlC-like cupin family protein
MTPKDWLDIAKNIAGVLPVALVVLRHLHRIRRRDIAELKADGEARKKAITEEFHQTVVDLIRKGMETAADEAGVDHTHVIRISFLTGHYVAVPLTRKWVTVARSGAAIQLLHSDHESTRYQLDCPGPYEIESHSHPENEHVTIVYGDMEDMNTGRIYGPGDTWEIPSGVPHHVLFSTGTLACIVVTPALPTARQVPISLDDLKFIGRP